MKREITDEEKEVFEYLNDLRESGDTNMYGARSYIEAAYPELSRSESGRILSLWMKNFNKEGSYETVTD